jgi:hypothetical protein
MTKPDGREWPPLRFHCWTCKWADDDERKAREHATAEPTHKVTRSSDTWHRPIAGTDA